MFSNTYSLLTCDAICLIWLSNRGNTLYFVKTNLIVFLSTEEGQLYSWGSNSEGQIGHGDEIDDDSCAIPTKVKIRGKVVSVACGYYHMAVVTG